MEKFNPQKVKNLNKLNAVLKLFFHTKKVKEKIEWRNVKKILVLDFTNIGDLIMLIPVLKILRKNAPQSELYLCCNLFGKDILEEQNLVDGFYLIDGIHSLNTPSNMIKNQKNLRNKIKEINQKCFDVILEPRGDLRYIFFMYFLNGKRKVSYNYTGGEEFLTDVVIPNPKVKHLVEDKLVFLKKIGCCFTKEEQFPKLNLSPEAKRYNKEFKEKYDITEKSLVIGIHPGASWETKRWRGYAQLLKRMQEKYQNAHFLIFSAKGEEEYVDSVKEIAEQTGLLFTIVSENLLNYIRLVSLCDVMICNDSGAGHIAAAYEIPVISIFGPTEPMLGKPYGKKVISLSYSLQCKPCNNPKCKFGTAQCIQTVSVDEVYKNICQILK